MIMKRMTSYVALLILGMFLVQCQESTTPDLNRYRPNQQLDSDKIFAVIETPAGVSSLASYDFDESQLVPAGDTIRFLPLPVNLGFIPKSPSENVEMQRESLQSCMVLSTSITPLDMIEIKPVGVLLMEKEGRQMDLVVAVPTDPSLKSIDLNDFVDLMTKYDAVRFQLQHWFANHLGPNVVKVKGWEDEDYADRLINQQ